MSFVNDPLLKNPDPEEIGSFVNYLTGITLDPTFYIVGLGWG